jgi:hypothetical protein
VSSSRLVYNQRQDATPKQEIETLARVYHFAIQRLKEKATEGSGGEDDAMKGSNNDRARDILHPRP